MGVWLGYVIRSSLLITLYGMNMSQFRGDGRRAMLSGKVCFKSSSVYMVMGMRMQRASGRICGVWESIRIWTRGAVKFWRNCLDKW